MAREKVFFKKKLSKKKFKKLINAFALKKLYDLTRTQKDGAHYQSGWDRMDDKKILEDCYQGSHCFRKKRAGGA